MSRYGLLVIIAFSLFSLIACKDNPREDSLEKRKERLEQQKAAIEKETQAIERQQEALREQREGIEDAVEDQREAYKRSVDAKLDEFDAQIDEFRARAKIAEKAGRDRFNKATDELKTKLEAARNRVGDFKSEGSKGLQNFKSGMDAIIADLEQSFNQVRSRFVR